MHRIQKNQYTKNQYITIKQLDEIKLQEQNLSIQGIIIEEIEHKGALLRLIENNINMDEKLSSFQIQNSFYHLSEKGIQDIFLLDEIMK
jgi:spore coat protein CotF